MSADGSGRFTRLLVLVLSISLRLIPGLSENPLPSKDSTKADSHSNSRSNTGLKVLLICLGVVILVLLSFFLFKMWQKKKREEQHARLLKLFEEDDELELELGIRD